MAVKRAKSVRVDATPPGVVIVGSGNNKSEPRSARQSAVAVTAGSDSNRLLREAAWSQMFGRVESKNPFTR
jgi:hypothetical protein